MYNTFTSTSTYTVVDIRKTFEGFSADFRMIAARTEKMSPTEVDNIVHDILQWAEAKYLDRVDVTLLDASNKPLRATVFTVDEQGKAQSSDRAGANNWPNIPNTTLTAIVIYNSAWRELPEEKQRQFKREKGFKMTWGKSLIDNSYSHLTKGSAQLYASKGYELKKENYI